MPISRISQSAQDTVEYELARRYRSSESRKLYIDHLIEKTGGRPLDKRELEAMKARIAQHLQGLFCEP